MKQLLVLIFAAFIMTGFVLFNSNKSAPTKRSEMASTLWKGKMYVAGGINLGGSNKSFEAFDIKNNRWEKLPSLPKKLNHIGVSAYKDTIFISGGFFNARQTKFSDVLYAYSIKEKQWKEITKMPAERGAHLMIQRDNYLHLIGGRNHKTIWSFNLKTRIWETDEITPLPEKRDHISVLQDIKNLYVMGGRQSGEVQKDCWTYDFDTKEWSTFAELPVPRGGQSACLHNNQIHITGGEDLQESITYARHDIFNLTSKKWAKGIDLQIARHGFVSELFKGKWYIFGGGKKAGIKTLYSTTTNLEVLDL